MATARGLRRRLRAAVRFVSPPAQRQQNPGSVIVGQLRNSQTNHRHTWPRSNELSMKQHVTKLVAACNYHLRHLRQIRQCVRMKTTTRHDHTTTRLLQLSASRLTAVYTRSTSEVAKCCSMGYIQCSQAGVHTSHRTLNNCTGYQYVLECSLNCVFWCTPSITNNVWHILLTCSPLEWHQRELVSVLWTAATIPYHA